MQYKRIDYCHNITHKDFPQTCHNARIGCIRKIPICCHGWLSNSPITSEKSCGIYVYGLYILFYFVKTYERNILEWKHMGQLWVFGCVGLWNNGIFSFKTESLCIFTSHRDLWMEESNGWFLLELIFHYTKIGHFYPSLDA